jgi:hypothetical protein
MRILLVHLLLLTVGVSHAWAQASSWHSSSEVCQILDQSPDPAYTLGLTYIADSRFRGYGSSRFAQLDGSMELGYYHDLYCGDIDLQLDLDAMLLFSSADLQLPDQLVALALDAGWTWRYINDLSLQVRIAPGIYSDIEELAFRSFTMPISVAGVLTVSPELSATAGFQLRPRFDRVLMPILGVVWVPADWLRVEATLPEARVLYYYDDEWSAHFGWAWESMTYSIREKGDYNRRRITFESYRTAVGVTRTLPDELRLTAEIGMLLDRSARFERTPAGMPEHIDVEDELFLRVGVGGPF